MGKKKAKANTGQPAYIAELLDTGTAVIKAASREALGDIIDQIPAHTRYAAGAIGRNTLTRLYELRIDLVK